MLNDVTGGVKAWLVRLFASAVTKTTRADDRVAAIQWLGQSRDVLASDLQTVEKFKQLNALVNSRTVAITIARNVAEGIKNYRNADLPLSVKVALPATLAAIPLVGGQGAGIAAFGSALGVPVLLLIFLGTAGITSIIEAIITNPDARPQIAEIIDVIIEDERLRQVSKEMKAAMKAQPADAMRHPMPEEEHALRQHLLTMDPFHFEQHAVSFFKAAGLVAWVTPRSNDMGADGFAEHDEGAIVIQCKRNAPDNKIGRPIVQQFKGVIEENGAFRGYIITTSSFTDEAKGSADMSSKIVLIDMDKLVGWHTSPPQFDDIQL